MTLDQINAEYARICREIGDAEFQIRQFQIFVSKKLADAQKLNELAGKLKEAQNTADTNKA